MGCIQLCGVRTLHTTPRGVVVAAAAEAAAPSLGPVWLAGGGQRAARSAGDRAPTCPPPFEVKAVNVRTHRMEGSRQLGLNAIGWCCVVLRGG